MARIEIKIEREKVTYDEMLPIKEQYWYRSLDELDWARNQVFEQLKKTLPNKYSGLSLDDFLKKQLANLDEQGCDNPFDLTKKETDMDKLIKILNSGGGVEIPKERILIETEKGGIGKEQTEQMLDRLKRNGVIYEPKHHHYNVTELPK